MAETLYTDVTGVPAIRVKVDDFGNLHLTNLVRGDIHVACDDASDFLLACAGALAEWRASLPHIPTTSHTGDIGALSSDDDIPF